MDSPHLFERIVDHSAQGLFVVGRERRVVVWNRWIAEATGTPMKDAYGRRYTDIFRPEDIPRLILAIDQALEDGCSSALSNAFTPHALPISSFQDPDALMPLSLAVTVFRDASEDRYALVEVHDATSSTQREQLLRMQHVSLEDANMEMQKANAALQESEQRTRALLNSTAHISILLDREGTVLAANEPAAMLLGTPVTEMEGRRLFGLHLPRQLDAWSCGVEEVLRTASSAEFDEKWGQLLLETSVHPVLDAEGQVVGTAITALDVSEQRGLERQLLHAQKMESIGHLAAGIAHEINTPAQYVGDNTRFLEESLGELMPLLKKADELAEAVRLGTGSSELAEDLRAALDEADVEFLAEEMPRAIGQSLMGLDRVRKIVQSMKEFSHPGGGEMIGIDLNHAIQGTITLATNEWRYVAEVETDLDLELPAVPCLPGELSQVVLNMIVNAAHAIAESMTDDEQGKGTITVSTRFDAEFAEIRIADTGTGIPEELRTKIFDPFFTTKAVGKGTGQGLSIAHSVVVKKHGGTLDFESEIGKGTTFIIRLPLVGGGVVVESSP